MSVAVVLNVHDGVILAADSASTLIVSGAQPGPQVANVYNNANKIVNLFKGQPIGCVTFGAGSIGDASITTLLKDFRAKLVQKQYFEISSYSMEGVATKLGEFLIEECQNLPTSTVQPTLGLFLAGYSTDKRLGERWSLYIENGQLRGPEMLHKLEDAGISWGGDGGDAIARLLLGYGNKLPEIVRNAVRPEHAGESLLQLLTAQLATPVMFAPMPIQDAIDLAEFLVHTAIQFSRFTPGAQVVGGPIEIAAITKHEGFKWIQRKHYYSADLNRELLHRITH